MFDAGASTRLIDFRNRSMIFEVSQGLLVLQRFLIYFLLDIMLPGIPKQVGGNENLLIILLSWGKNAGLSRICRLRDFLLFRLPHRDVCIVSPNDDIVWLRCMLLVKLDIQVMEGRVILLLNPFFRQNLPITLF